MKYLLTFLGTTKYQKTKYQWQAQQPIETKWIAKACAQVFKPDKIFVVVTSKAQNERWPEMKEEIGCDYAITPVPIKDGRSEDELWDIFNAIVESIPEECELVIDVTHGFRSQPMVALAIAVYLQHVRKVKITNIVYGAFEAIEKDTGIAPIFELKPFLDFIDWTFAISQFNKSGSADLLKTIMQKSKSNEKDQLGLIAADLESTSRALHLLRPKETHKNAQKAAIHLKNAREKIHTNIKAKPFSPLIDEVENTLKEFSTDYREEDGFQILQTHLKMISWYLKKEKYMQAICLAREWFGRFHAHYLGWDLTKKRFRKPANELLDKIIYGKDNQSKLHPDFPVELFKEIKDTRNQVAHANDEYDSATLIAKIRDNCNRLITIGNQLCQGAE